MHDLDRAVAAIRAVRDCPAVRRLCMDLRGYALAHGESEGLRLAAVILKGVRAYQRHEDSLRSGTIWRRTMAYETPT